MQNKNELIINYLTKLFPNAKCELDYNSPFELLIAVILSAQCTDKRVNVVTKKLFNKYPSAQLLSEANLEDVEKIIMSCGLYKTKAKNIIFTSKMIVEKYNNIVPQTQKELEQLCGVGRKTANVVLSTIYDKNVIAVDTHVLRVSNRLGLTKSKNPLVCEKNLTTKFKNNLDKLHIRMVLFGRYYCKAINPECGNCELKCVCKFNNCKNHGKNK